MGRRVIYESRGLFWVGMLGEKLGVYVWELPNLNFTYINFSRFQTKLMPFLGFWPFIDMFLKGPLAKALGQKYYKAQQTTVFPWRG